jgi:orsellinic acid C2-O-methyltransferase
LSDFDDSERLGDLLDGHINTQLIAAAVRFGIPDLLGEDVVAEDRLGDATGMSPAILRRFLYALHNLGLVEPASDGNWRGTAMTRHLRRDTGSLYGHALMAGNLYYEAWADLDFSLCTGRSAFERRHGGSLWDRLGADQETAAAFTRTMRWNTERTVGALLGLYPFHSSGLIADIGAGDGTVTAALLTRFPGMRAIVFEQPSVLESTRRSVQEQGLCERCSFVAGDFLDGVPEGADLYLLKSVIHNWDDIAALRILRNCRQAMAGTARLLLIEHAADTADPVGSAMRDMIMLVLFGSQDRTAGEYSRLLAAAGFEVKPPLSGPAGLRLLEAIPG